MYGAVHWANVSAFTFEGGASSVCTYVVAVHVVASVLYPLGMGSYFAYAVYKSRADKQIGSVNRWNIINFAYLFTNDCGVYVINALTCRSFCPFLWSQNNTGKFRNFEHPLASHCVPSSEKGCD